MPAPAKTVVRPLTHAVKSRVNGLEIAIPADAAGVSRNFASKGGNELVFDKKSVSNAIRNIPKKADKKARATAEDLM